MLLGHLEVGQLVLAASRTCTKAAGSIFEPRLNSVCKAAKGAPSVRAAKRREAADVATAAIGVAITERGHLHLGIVVTGITVVDKAAAD